MDEIRLKRGFFGYTKRSVNNYISRIDAEFQRIMEERNKMCAEYEQMKSGYDELVSRAGAAESAKAELEEQLEELKKTLAEAPAAERTENYDDVYQHIHTEVADIIIEAKKFADMLKLKAENEYNKQVDENNKAIARETDRINSYIDKLDNICAAARDACETFDENMGRKKSEMNSVIIDINAG